MFERTSLFFFGVCVPRPCARGCSGLRQVLVGGAPRPEAGVAHPEAKLSRAGEYSVRLGEAHYCCTYWRLSFSRASSQQPTTILSWLTATSLPRQRWRAARGRRSGCLAFFGGVQAATGHGMTHTGYVIPPSEACFLRHRFLSSPLLVGRSRTIAPCPGILLCGFWSCAAVEICVALAEVCQPALRLSKSAARGL